MRALWKALLVSLFAWACTQQYELFPGSDELTNAGGSGASAAGAAFGGNAAGGGAAAGGASTASGGSAAASGSTASPPSAGATLAARDSHSCSLESGVPWCWGNNAHHALGLENEDLTGEPPSRLEGAPELAALELGRSYGCGLSVTGAVWCWGRNDVGQLGTGDFVSRPRPQHVPLPSEVEHLTTGSAHACAVLRNDTLWCWGENGERQLGDPTTWDDQPSPVQVGKAADWARVSAGDGHTCGIRTGGSLYCWGRNTQGQLGLGPDAPIQPGEPTLVDEVHVWTAVASDLRVTCGIVDPGELYCWGNNEQGQLGTGGFEEQLRPARVGARSSWKAVSVNALHTCAIDRADELWCWGRGIEGQLGLGDADRRTVPTRVGSGFNEVAIGRLYTCARTSAGAVLCTGRNSGGAVGLPTEVDRVFELTEVSGLP